MVKAGPARHCCGGVKECWAQLVLKTPREPLVKASALGGPGAGQAIWYEFLFGSKPQAASSKGKIIFDNISFVWDKMI